MDGMVQRVRSRARERMMDTRLDRTDRENERLRTQAAMLREELGRERATEADLRETLRASAKGRTVKVRRGNGRLRMLLVVAGAYVLGAKAGRERYEQIMSWLDTQRRGITGKMHREAPVDPARRPTDEPSSAAALAAAGGSAA
ncbi:MAG: hypothetical protein ACM3OO_07780 [Planctomycetaceae bacterium]